MFYILCYSYLFVIINFLPCLLKHLGNSQLIILFMMLLKMLFYLLSCVLHCLNEWRAVVLHQLVDSYFILISVRFASFACIVSSDASWADHHVSTDYGQQNNCNTGGWQTHVFHCDFFASLHYWCHSFWLFDIGKIWLSTEDEFCYSAHFYHSSCVLVLISLF